MESQVILARYLSYFSLILLTVTDYTGKRRLKRNIFYDLNVISHSIRITFFICKIIRGSSYFVVTSNRGNLSVRDLCQRVHDSITRAVKRTI